MHTAGYRVHFYLNLIRSFTEGSQDLSILVPE